MGIMSTHVDDFCWRGEECFVKNVIDPLRSVFLIGSECDTTFKYVGLCMTQQDDFSIKMDQTTYMASIKPVPVFKQQSMMRHEPLNNNELKRFRSVIGQLGWAAGQTRLTFTIVMFWVCFGASRFPGGGWAGCTGGCSCLLGWATADSGLRVLLETAAGQWVWPISLSNAGVGVLWSYALVDVGGCLPFMCSSLWCMLGVLGALLVEVGLCGRGCFSMWLVWPLLGGPWGCNADMERLSA